MVDDDDGHRILLRSQLDTKVFIDRLENRDVSVRVCYRDRCLHEVSAASSTGGEPILPRPTKREIVRACEPGQIDHGVVAKVARRHIAESCRQLRHGYVLARIRSHTFHETKPAI
jgi:hypothetical protein